MELSTVYKTCTQNSTKIKLEIIKTSFLNLLKSGSSVHIRYSILLYHFSLKLCNFLMFEYAESKIFCTKKYNSTMNTKNFYKIYISLYSSFITNLLTFHSLKSVIGAQGTYKYTHTQSTKTITLSKNWLCRNKVKNNSH